ncbi:MAG: hypothetical protein AWU57_23 [Marinobacter sp. T13-3]|nr:MAG: hypothetical protein AWU57_23 [Marinobacter sp. T13-3]
MAEENAAVETTEQEPDYQGWKLREDEVDATPPFPEGFPNPLAKPGQMAIIEDALILRAHAQGITEVEVKGVSVPALQAFRCNGLLPILTDYLTHSLYRQMNLMFDTELMETLMTERLESMDMSAGDFISQMNQLEKDIQRPLFFNEKDDNSMLGARTSVSTLATVPASVTVLLMDAAIESAHTLSQNEQLNFHGDPSPHILDLTPVVQSLEAQNVNPRVVVPENLHARVKRLVEKLEAEMVSENEGDDLDLAMDLNDDPFNVAADRLSAGSDKQG